MTHEEELKSPDQVIQVIIDAAIRLTQYCIDGDTICFDNYGDEQYGNEVEAALLELGIISPNELR